jgi:hypothetical protein
MSKAQFGPDADFTNMIRLFEQWAGVEAIPHKKDAGKAS